MNTFSAATVFLAATASALHQNRLLRDAASNETLAPTSAPTEPFPMRGCTEQGGYDFAFSLLNPGAPLFNKTYEPACACEKVDDLTDSYARFQVAAKDTKLSDFFNQSSTIKLNRTDSCINSCTACFDGDTCGKFSFLYGQFFSYNIKEEDTIGSFNEMLEADERFPVEIETLCFDNLNGTMCHHETFETQHLADQPNQEASCKFEVNGISCNTCTHKLEFGFESVQCLQLDCENVGLGSIDACSEEGRVAMPEYPELHMFALILEYGIDGWFEKGTCGVESPTELLTPGETNQTDAETQENVEDTSSADSTFRVFLAFFAAVVGVLS